MRSTFIDFYRNVFVLLALSVCASEPAGAADGAPAANDAKESRPRTEPQSQIVDDAELFPSFLAKPTSVRFSDRKILEAFQYLEKMHGTPIVVNRPQLTQFGFSLDQTVSLHVPKATYSQVLTLLCENVGLSWHVDNELIRISYNQNAPQFARHFDFRGLMKKGYSPQKIVEIVRLGSDEWREPDDGGDGGTYAWIGETLSVSHHFHEARRIARLVNVIKNPPDVMQIMEEEPVDRRLVDVLKAKGDIEVDDVPLSEVLSRLAEKFDAPIVLDRRMIQEYGCSVDASVTMSYNQQPLARLLEELLMDAQLGFRIHQGVIQVTPSNVILADMFVAAYRVQDLLVHDEMRSQLVDALMVTSGSNWEMNDDAGGVIILSEIDGILFVKHVAKVQEGIQKQLQKLREIYRDRKPGSEPVFPVSKKLKVRGIRVSKEIAADLLVKIPKLIEPEHWQVVNGETPSIETIATDPFIETVEGPVTGATDEVHTLTIEEEGFPDPNLPKPQPKIRSLVHRPRSILVIRQTPEVQKQIRQLLNELQIPFEDTTNRNSGIGMMGGGGFF